MPLYDYKCDACGSFSAWGRMAEASVPAPCPECGNPGERVITAPHLALLNDATRTAHARNERSAHEPRSVRRGCGCGGAHTCKPAAKQPTSLLNKSVTKPRLQAQKKAHARPWMLGH